MKILAFLAVLFVLTVNCPAQLSPFKEDRQFETKVEQLLKQRDVGELANELAQSKAAGMEDLLIRLSVFARAGHRARVIETLREIVRTEMPNRENPASVFHIAQRAVNADDLAAQKIFYEHFARAGDENTDRFIGLWNKEGDSEELETWLGARVAVSESWWDYWIGVKRSRGTLMALAEDMERQIRENPADFALVRKYLRVVKPVAGTPNVSWYEQNVSWLADVVKTDSAYAAFALAMLLKDVYPAIGVKLLKKSLALRFTEYDPQIFAEGMFRTAAVSQGVKNPEKQLRVWTKQALVEIYQKTDQAKFAQPIVEELTAMDMSDVQAFDAFLMAGAVQSTTGARVVETRILKDEKANENSTEYWLKRAEYYRGRKEKAAVWKTFQLALEKFAYKPNDYQASLPRLRILYSMKDYGADEDQKATEGILRNEFVKARARGDLRYLFGLTHIIGEDFEALTIEFFVNTDLLPKILATRPKWSYDEIFMIRSVAETDAWDEKKLDNYWNQLAALARRELAGRAFNLADAMYNDNEELKAIPLLEECLKIAPLEYGGSLNFNRADVENALFENYISVGDWQKAEKLWLDGFRKLGSELDEVAVAAAQKGKIDEAVRLWKTYANFDRRRFGGLYELAKTEAKAPLREFYSRMKIADPLSDIPDKALAILQ